MEIKKEIISTTTIGYKCDICHKNIDDNNLRLIDFRELREFQECDMCEDCFDKVETYIVKELRGTIRDSFACMVDGKIRTA